MNFAIVFRKNKLLELQKDYHGMFSWLKSLAASELVNLSAYLSVCLLAYLLTVI